MVAQREDDEAVGVDGANLVDCVDEAVDGGFVSEGDFALENLLASP